MMDDAVDVKEVDSLDDLEEEGLHEALGEGGTVLQDELEEVALLNVLVHDVPELVLIDDVDEADDVGVGWQATEGADLLLHQLLGPLGQLHLVEDLDGHLRARRGVRPEHHFRVVSLAQHRIKVQ